MIDLEALEQARKEACIDKAELFDLYHDYWDVLIQEIRRLRERLEEARWDAMGEDL